MITLSEIDQLPLKFRHKLKAMQWVRFREIEKEIKEVKL